MVRLRKSNECEKIREQNVKMTTNYTYLVVSICDMQCCFTEEGSSSRAYSEVFMNASVGAPQHLTDEAQVSEENKN